jgi:SAM-dependent methyltransferase
LNAGHLGAWLNDPNAVRAQYASADGLAARSSLYGDITGDDPSEIAFEAVAELRPKQFLEVGCGTGWFAARVQQELGPEVVAIDQSERMVELARARGVNAAVGDVQSLSFAADSFDCAAANWMLYHLPDLDRGLAELARVLRPGGRLVSITNGRDHLLEIWRLVGAADARQGRHVTFAAENGAAALERHFESVEARDAGGTVTIHDRAAIVDYLRSIEAWAPFAEQVPGDLETPFVARRATVVFVATA